MRFIETIIIGGGPAGSSCAWRLRNRGHNVIVLERQTFPRVKLCAGWITGKVLRDLEFSETDYPHTILKLVVRMHIRSLPFALPWFLTSDGNYSIRRVEFDQWLLERSGAPVITHTVKHICRDNDLYVIDDRFICRNLVGAGGTMCPVRRTLFPENRRGSQQIVTLEKEFEYPSRQDTCHLYFFDRGLKGYSWYVPKSDGFVNIGLGGKSKFFKRSGTNIHEHFQAFLARLVRERRLDAETAAGLQYSGHPYYLASWHGELQKDRCFLIGDSAGLATVDLGEGIGPAIESGLLAAEAILGEATYSRTQFTKYSSGGLVQKLARRLMPIRGSETKPAPQPDDESRQRAAA